MGRIKGGTNKYWCKEEKLRIIKRVTEEKLSTHDVSRGENISNGMLNNWLKKYYELGIEGLENKRKPGNPLARYSSKKSLTKEEALEYENMKLRIENERLKKGYIVRGSGQNKEYITIRKKNLK